MSSKQDLHLSQGSRIISEKVFAIYKMTLLCPMHTSFHIVSFLYSGAREWMVGWMMANHSWKPFVQNNVNHVHVQYIYIFQQLQMSQFIHFLFGMFE